MPINDDIYRLWAAGYRTNIQGSGILTYAELSDAFDRYSERVYDTETFTPRLDTMPIVSLPVHNYRDPSNLSIFADHARATFSETHPCRFIEKLYKELNVTECKVAAYKYAIPEDAGGNGYSGEYSEIDEIIDGNEFAVGFKNFLLLHNGADGDIALKSRVMVNDKPYHLPMIDFVCKDFTLIKEAIDYSSEILGLDSTDFVFYNSGASFHAYGNILLDETDFNKFSSLLLLVKHPTSKKRIVDTRWVGHSQLKGCFSLRLTAFNKPQLPQLVKQ